MGEAVTALRGLGGGVVGLGEVGKTFPPLGA
jgi:hypothetical protein